MAFVSHRLTLADDIHSPFSLPFDRPAHLPREYSCWGPDVALPRAVRGCPEKKGCERKREGPRLKTRNSSQKHSRTGFVASPAPRPPHGLPPVGRKRAKGKRGASETGWTMRIEFHNRATAGTMRRNCVTTRVRIYYIDGAVRAGQGMAGGRKGTTCVFLRAGE